MYTKRETHPRKLWTDNVTTFTSKINSVVNLALSWYFKIAIISSFNKKIDETQWLGNLRPVITLNLRLTSTHIAALVALITREMLFLPCFHRSMIYFSIVLHAWSLVHGKGVDFSAFLLNSFMCLSNRTNTKLDLEKQMSW